jgi:ABC-type multidrug transport system fused ATPase/permease subunit
LFTFYALVTDLRILGEVIGESVDEDTSLSNVVVLIGFMIFVREVVFHRYVIMVGISVISMFMYIVLFFTISQVDTAVILGEFLLLTTANVLLCSDCYKTEIRARQLFWRKLSEEEMSQYDNNLSHIASQKDFNSPLEEMLHRLDISR